MAFGLPKPAEIKAMFAESFGELKAILTEILAELRAIRSELAGRR